LIVLHTRKQCAGLYKFDRRDNPPHDILLPADSQPLHTQCVVSVDGWRSPSARPLRNFAVSSVPRFSSSVSLFSAQRQHTPVSSTTLIRGSSLGVTKNVRGGCAGSRKVCSQVRHCGALSADAFRHFSSHSPIPSKNLRPSGSLACALCHSHSRSPSR